MGKQWKQTLFWGAPKSLQMVTAAMKLKDAYSLEVSLRNFPGGSEVKASVSNAGDLGLIPGSGRSLEKETATHFSTLVWEIPWTEELGKLQSMGSQRVRHNSVTKPQLDSSLQRSW